MKNNKALIGVFAAVIVAAVLIIVLVAKNASAPSQEQPDASPAVTATQAPDADNTVDDTAAQEPDASPSADTGAAAASEEEQKVYTPTFMYFVSDSDEGYDATMVMLDELKKEYDGRVKFDIRNIDENPELVDSFPVKDNTPTLIMLNTKNDISNILFKTKDKEKLTEAIKAALAS